MSFRVRFILSLMVATLSLCTFNAFAETTDSSTQAAPSATTPATSSTMTTTTTTTTKTHHVKMKKMVNLNTADVKDLAKVRGIGKKKAAVIIAYRTKNGSFSSVDDLKNVMNAKGKPLFSPKAIIILKKRLIVNGS